MEQRRLNSRQRRLWELRDFSAGRGLEIGPLHNRSMQTEYADVRYLDVFDRATLIERHRNEPNVNPDYIPEIDFVLFDGLRVRTIPETVGADRFDWVVASHVIEHVPDVIGWLAQVADVVVDGGSLILVVPDRRHCFDVHRPGTTTGMLLQAHEMGDTVPSIRAVYDYARGHVGTNAKQTWSGQPPGYEKRLYDLPAVLNKVEQARRGEYVDAHVWTFTPGTLVEQLIELRQIGLTSWAIRQVQPTRPETNEFLLALERLPRSGDWPPDVFVDEPTARMPDWLEEEVALRARLRVLEDRLGRAWAELDAANVATASAIPAKVDGAANAQAPAQPAASAGSVASLQSAASTGTSPDRPRWKRVARRIPGLAATYRFTRRLGRRAAGAIRRQDRGRGT